MYHCLTELHITQHYPTLPNITQHYPKNPQKNRPNKSPNPSSGNKNCIAKITKKTIIFLKLKMPRCPAASGQTSAFPPKSTSFTVTGIKVMNASIPDNREITADSPAAILPPAGTAVPQEPVASFSSGNETPAEKMPGSIAESPENDLPQNTPAPANSEPRSDATDVSGNILNCVSEQAAEPDAAAQDIVPPEADSKTDIFSPSPKDTGITDTSEASRDLKENENTGINCKNDTSEPLTENAAEYRLPDSSAANPDNTAPETALPKNAPEDKDSPAAPPIRQMRERKVIDPLLFVTYSGKPENGDYSETPPAARNLTASLSDSENADTTWLHALPYSVGAIVHTITNSRGNTVSVMDWGATVLDFSVWDPDKKLVYHPVLGTKPSRYAEQRIQLGATVGRVANRIARGRFELNGQTYSLVRDSGYEHTLHGGITGFSEKRFEFTKVSPSSVTLKLVSPDMDNGFPGNLTLLVTYTLDDDNALHIDYEAASSRDTPINITSHIYWNLSLRNSLEGQFLKAEKAVILNTDNTGIPDGTVSTQEESPLDFSGILPLSYNIEAATECYPFGGIDHVLAYQDPRLPDKAAVWDTPDADSTPVTLLCELYCPETMLTLEVYSDYPALQVYSGNALEGVPGRTAGKIYRNHEGLALEPEYFPDAINHPEFQARCPVLKAGKTFRKSIVYKIVQNRIPEILEPLEVLEEELAALEAQENQSGEPFFRDVYLKGTKAAKITTFSETPECRELSPAPATPKAMKAPAPGTEPPASVNTSRAGTKLAADLSSPETLTSTEDNTPLLLQENAAVSGSRKAENPFFRDSAPPSRNKSTDSLPESANSGNL